MDILEVMNQFEDGTTFFIGSEAGSSFFFIGDKELWKKCNKMIEKWYKHTNKELLKKTKAKLISLKKPLTRGLIPARGHSYVFEKIKESDSEFEKRSRQHKVLQNKCERNIWRYQDNIDIFKPFKDREVVEVRKRLCDDGYIIIIPGNEMGSFWFESEWRLEKYEIK